MHRLGVKIILLLAWLFPGVKASCQTNQQDSLALVDLYNSTNGPAWSLKTGWLTGNVSSWYGITVTGGRVTEIFFISNGLTGPLPTSIGNLTALTTLVIFQDQLSGTIPVQLGNLTQLTYINFGFNQLTGTIPATLGQLVNIQNLALNNNNLTGVIPAGIGNLINLNGLDFSSNSLSGPLPAGLFSLSNMTNLSLNSNQISDTLRNSIYGLQSIQSLDLSYNLLKGPLPDSLYAIQTIQQINLSHNQLTGELSPRIDNLVNLNDLNVSFNQLACRIPGTLDNLTSLNEVYLNNNRFDAFDPWPNQVGNPYLTLNVTNNRLQFADIEVNHSLNGFTYSPQDSLFWPITDHLAEGSTFYEDSPVAGSDNTYQWYKDGSSLPDNGTDIFRPGVILSDAGRYILEIRSNVITDLVLYRKAVILTVTSCLTKVAAKDSLALVSIYNALGGPNWTNHTGWLTAPLPLGSIDSWKGVTMDNCGHVLNLTLTNNNLVGNAPIQIGDLTYLVQLDLSSNSNLTSVPNELGKLSNLQVLVLSDDGLNSTYPSWVTNLTSLTYLNIGNNQLKGQIPESMSDLGELVTWYSGTNKLSGPIPASICLMKNLVIFNLDYNQLSGSIPNSIGELKNLEELSLGYNKLSGFIPPTLNNLTALKVMDLSVNQLTGGLPLFDQLVNLEVLDVPANALSGPFSASIQNMNVLRDINLENNFFADVIPPFLGSFTNLQSINFGFNQLTGNIPHELGQLNQLLFISLAQNKLTGPIPVELGNLSQLGFIDFSRNQLSGSIPAQLGNLTNLYALWLYTNQLTDSIPPELGNLVNVGTLALGDNLLTGPIPPELGSLPKLGQLGLYHNLLTGPLPKELANDTKLFDISVYENQLTGPIPHEYGSLTEMQIFDVFTNQLTDSLPAELGNWHKIQGFEVAGNQLTGTLPKEFASFTELNVFQADHNNFKGAIPIEYLAWTKVKNLYLSNNHFTSIPNFSPNSLIDLQLDKNNLTFESLEPYVAHAPLGNFFYIPQDSVGTRKSATQMTDCPYTAPANVGGSANSYQWYKNGVPISGQTAATLNLPKLAAADAAKYTCAVNSSIVTGLTLNTLPITISVNPRIDAFLNEDLTNAQCNVRTLIATPSTLFTYQWYLDGDKMVGATNETLVAFYDGAYTVAYQPDPTTCKLKSPALGVIGLYADVQPVITGSGSPVTSASTPYSAPSYQWYVDDKVIAGADSASINIWYNGAYYLVVMLANNCNYRSNTIVVNESKYINLSRLGMTKSDTIILVPPYEMVSVYPNPAKEIVTIDSGPFPATGIEFLDNTNKSVYKKDFEQPFKSWQVDVSSLSQGVYLISIGSDEKRIWRKLVKY